MKILSLDSSSESASIAILEEDKLLGEMTFNYKKQHSVILMPMIDTLLHNLSMNIDDIDGFVVSKGPGSFTGLRIGMATIKGLSLGTDKPFIGVSSLDALAYNLFEIEGIVCPVMDALRNNVYTCLYTYEKGKLKVISDYMAVSIEDLANLLNSYDKKVYFIGDATYKYKSLLQSKVNNCTFAPSHLNLARASSLGEIGLKKIQLGFKDDLNNSAPIYLRKSQAEREYDKKMGIKENE